MKNLSYLLILLILLVSCTQKNENKTAERFKEICSVVKADNIPDKRVQVFDPVLDETGKTLVLRGVTTNATAKKQLVDALKQDGISILDSMEILPQKSLGDKVYGVTSLSVINFRTAPDYDAEAATQTMMGTPLRLLQKEDGWVRAITPEGYIAWVRSSGVAEMTKAEFENYKNAKKVIVTSKYVSIMNEIPFSNDPVSDAVWGNILLDLGDRGFHKIVGLADGRKGLINKKDIMDFDQWCQTRNANPENIIETAKQFMGVPYMWGATSIKAVDCSGFSKSVYYLNGLVLARDASQQCYTGDDVDISKYVNDSTYTLDALKNLRKGDLVFFGRKAVAGKKERITHVGIYIENGQFIHSAGFVHINSLIPTESDYYTGSVNLVRAQRIIGNEDKGKGIESITKAYSK